ncbi:uncharacterized protein LOC114274168 [Camellia sinensis]|uniref:uncharacterized protein LOC114274168 n=1 Tax=Camellia sinensis TaxID=4442 RepID=UPI0010362691|nr:uncharacterized protein LOC114274168 [Camellia sinensis]
MGHQMFSFMDGFSGYNQIKMALKDAEKTAFRTPLEKIFYTVMPFGLKNAGATYQRVTTAIFHDMLHHEVEVYMHDLVVKSIEANRHLCDLEKVFQRCRKFCLKMNSLKCVFEVTAGKFLGFLVHWRGIEVDGDKIKSIMEMPPPHSQKALKKFLGKVSYLRRFIPTLAEITFSFGTLLKGNHKFEWLQEHQHAFDMVKKALTSPLTMIAPQLEKHLLLYLASTPRSIGALLIQDIDGIEKPVYYISHKVVTQSDPVSYLLGKPALTGRIRRWLLALAERGITCVTPKAIKSQVLANLLAQFPSSKHEPAEVPLPDEVHVSTAVIETYWDLKLDGASGAGKGGAGITFTSQEEEKFHLSYKLDFECSNNEAEYEALILGLIAAQKKGLHKLRIWGDSKLVVKQTMGDFTLKEPLLAPYRTMVQRLLTQFEDVQIQHTPRTHNHFPNALATLGAKVEIPDDSIAIVIEKRITPAMLVEEHTEQDTEGWKADIIQQLKTGQGIIKPAKLALFLLLKGELYFCSPNNLLAYRMSKRKPTQATPFFLVYGSKAVLPVELTVPSARMAISAHLVPDSRKNDIEAAEERRDRASRAMERYHQSIAPAYNQSVQHKKFNEGDLVWKTVDAIIRRQPISKSSPIWEGPYKVAKASSSGYYKLTRVDDRFRTGPINAKYVKEYFP